MTGEHDDSLLFLVKCSLSNNEHFTTIVQMGTESMRGNNRIDRLKMKFRKKRQSL